MTTERTAAEIIQFAENLARTFNQSAAVFRQAIEDGDEQGIGIERLAGRVEAYEDAALFIRGQVSRLRPDEVATHERRPRLEIVS